MREPDTPGGPQALRASLRAWLSAICLVLVLAGLGSASESLAQAAEPPMPLVRRIVTPRFTLLGQQIQVPGYALNDAPGAPQLPVRGVVFDLPPTGQWTLEARGVGSRVLPQRPAIPAVPVPNLSLLGPESWTRRSDLPGAVPTIDRPDPAIYGVDAFYPASPAVAAAEQWQRGRRLLAVRVFPFQYNPVTREVLYHPEIEVQVRVEGSRLQVAGSRSQVVGPGGRGQGSETADYGLRTTDYGSPTAATGAVRIRTTQRGLYRLTYDDLLAAGVPLDSVDPRSFFMSSHGQPVQIQVIGEEDGSFDPADRVIFYAVPYEGRYMTHNVYRLYWKQQPASPLSRMDTRTVSPTGNEPVVTAITQTLHVEFDRAYYSDYPLPQDADHWFDDPIYPSGSSPVVTRTYTLALDDPLATGEVAVRAQLYGGQDQTAAPDQSVKLWLNSHEVTTWQWDGRVGYLGQATAPAAWLDAAPNALKLEGALSQLPGLSEYWVYPDWVEVAYPAQPDAEDDRIVIEGVDQVGPTMQITVTGFTTATVRIYDVRRPQEPVQLTVSEAISDGLSYALHFADAWPEGEPPAAYALSTDDALLAPLAVEPDTLTTWTLTPHTADYIAIVHRSLWDAVQPLLDRRAAQGLRVAKVDVQDIYDEINDGLVDPEAIRTFLSHAYANWNEGGDPPRYVLLVGDGHYDFKGVSGTTLPNLIPPYLIHVDPWIGETAADNRYVSVDGHDDYLPDMAIGRIPARNPADVTAVVNKIPAYEDPLQAPDGDWQSKVVFVADNYADSAGNFHALSDEVRTNWLPPGYTTPRIYYRLDSSLDTGDEMRAAIKQAFNDRAVYLQWFGHASRFRWGGSVSMFNIFDPPNLAPNTQIPLTAHYACWTGYFINLYSNWQSLGEQLVLEPGRGSVADFAPSGLHIGSALLNLNRGLVLSLFRDRIREAGDAATQAKLYYFANSGAWHDVIDTQILFGDPAVRLRVPATPPTPPEVDIEAKGADATLSWPHQLDSSQYEVWRGTSPYFDPDAAEGALVSTVDAGFVGAGASFQFTDDGATPPPPVQIIGDPGTNYFWVLRSRNRDAASGLSNRVGEFDFALVAGE